MPVYVQVHAAVAVDGKLVVYRRRGHEVATLPGGRVKQRELVTAALVRETQEEIGIPIEVGPLLLAAEVLDAARETVVLVFAATPRSAGEVRCLELVDPASEEAYEVLPPVLGQLVRYARGVHEGGGARWMGNLYHPFDSLTA